MMKERGYKNIMEVPKIDKIVLNMRLGDVKDNAKSVQTAIGELGQIAGQKPVVCKAKKSVANFKVREGMTIGAKVTLRGFDIAVITTAKTDDEAKALLTKLGMPFKN